MYELYIFVYLISPILDSLVDAIVKWPTACSQQPIYKYTLPIEKWAATNLYLLLST